MAAPFSDVSLTFLSRVLAERAGGKQPNKEDKCSFHRF